MFTSVNFFIRLPLTTVLLLCVAGCTGNTYFISAKNQQRYDTSDINIFDDDDADKFDRSARSDAGTSGLSAKFSSAAYDRKAGYRDSGVIGKLYHDPDGEAGKQQPYEMTVRKSYRSYNVETALSEPIHVGDHDLTPHLSLSHHKDQNFVAGIVFRMPF